MTIPSITIPLSGERLRVTYRLAGVEQWARAQAEDICLEQTVEFPAELVPPGDIHDHILGRIESFESLDDAHYQAVISFAVETTGFELTQLLNVIFGNISIKPGIWLERVDLSEGLLKHFKGPRFGRQGWRDILDAPKRPLLATALKPMGLPARAIAQLAYQFARGGIDIIKDDHGLANQPFCPFRERLERCVEAVARANRETGERCIYMPNLTAPGDRVLENARLAKDAGAGGLLLAPALTGFDTMRQLADDDSIALPIMSHPSFLGSFSACADSGIAHYALYGQIMRLAGADATIFPNVGGRFSFSRGECASIVTGTHIALGELKPILPAPGGGMSLARVPDMLALYGREAIFLVGGGLHQHSPDLVANCRYFRRMIEEM